MPRKMSSRRRIAVLAACALGLLLLTTGWDSGSLSVDALRTRVVAARSRWVEVQVRVGTPADVSFVIRPRNGSPVFERTLWVSDSVLFQWRGRDLDGRAVPDGRYILDITTVQDGAPLARRVRLRVLNTPDPNDVTAPPVPRRLAVVAAQENDLSWEYASDRDTVFYRAYRAPDRNASYARVGRSAIEEFADDPPERAIFWYRIAGVDAAGNKSRLSAPVSSDNVHMSATVGSDGGALRPTTGTVRLDIPAGAVGAETEFTIDQLDDAPEPDVNRVIVTRAFHIGPSGTQFDPAATLTLAYEVPPGYRLPFSYPADTTTAQYFDPASESWKALQGTSVDESAATLEVPLPHLSILAAGSVTEPHGGYGAGTQLCGYCHQVHAAPGPNLHPRDTERETCYQCHDGTGAGTDIQSEFGEATIGSSTKTSFHPVPEATDGFTLVCGDCHTPHKLRADFTKLLRVDIGGTYVYSPTATPIGNTFCYACHGASSTLPGRFGDHTAFEGSVHDAQTSPPPSGSGIKCLACHKPHGSNFTGLATANQEDLCFSCHTQADPNTSGGSNPKRAFTVAANDYVQNADGVRLFHHPISDADGDGGTRQVECASCHNAHIADQTDNGSTTSKLVDPADTTSKFMVTWDDATMTRGNITDFCTKCHISPPTTQPIAAGPTVPYAIKLVNDTGQNNDGSKQPHDKFTLANWNHASNGRHGGAAVDPLACTACHDFHGSSNAFMLREDVVNPGGVCSTCDPVGGQTGTMTNWQADQSIAGDVAKIRSFCLVCHPSRGNHQVSKECVQCHYHTSGSL